MDCNLDQLISGRVEENLPNRPNISKNQFDLCGLALPGEGRSANEINRFATFLRANSRIDTHSLFRLLANFSCSKGQGRSGDSV
jgi:hypothetical protein